VDFETCLHVIPKPLKVILCFGQPDDLGFSLEDEVSNRALDNLLGLGIDVAARAQYLDREALVHEKHPWRPSTRFAELEREDFDVFDLAGQSLVDHQAQLFGNP
jgi:hypothetical protein